MGDSPQGVHLLPGLTALDNVALPLQVAGQTRAPERATRRPRPAPHALHGVQLEVLWGSSLIEFRAQPAHHALGDFRHP